MCIAAFGVRARSHSRPIVAAPRVRRVMGRPDERARMRQNAFTEWPVGQRDVTALEDAAAFGDRRDPGSAVAARVSTVLHGDCRLLQDSLRAREPDSCPALVELPVVPVVAEL